MKPGELEKYSSAITLSDMEVYVFPELVYALLLANIMSPVIWRWRDVDCFKKLAGKGSYKKLMRLRQFIMDEYEFNLDLETWGLTTKQAELKRFEKFISPQEIAASNALFGYEGDKYYFDVDIRRHFGLDKYDSDAIPYWKTETVEAMDAFVRKPGYTKKAGECVSLSALYAAAAFVVCEVPLQDIYAIITPLHSQNFIDIQDGVLTNNRRLVTKTMWFNGTAISNKAQRALRNESVTIVAHSTGYTHCLYGDATIDRSVYERFGGKLRSYLTTDLNVEIFANFLRCNPAYQRYFQLCRDCHGHPQFLKAEVLFNYEHGSNYRIADQTHEKLLLEVSDDDFNAEPISGRVRCDQLDDFLKAEKVDVRNASGRAALQGFLQPLVPDAERFVTGLADFVHVEPKLPSVEKHYVGTPAIELKVGQSREEIIDHLQQLRASNPSADLAFYAYRDMESCDWRPFIGAAVKRNPVSLGMVQPMSIQGVHAWLSGLNSASIYEGKRLAQPDEVGNYRTGDGIEKAFFLANVVLNTRHAEQLVPGRVEGVEIIIDNNDVVLRAGGEFRFWSTKGLRKQVQISSAGDVTVTG